MGFDYDKDSPDEPKVPWEWLCLGCANELVLIVLTSRPAHYRKGICGRCDEGGAVIDTSCLISTNETEEEWIDQ
jgi:hypothetical protein